MTTRRLSNVDVWADMIQGAFPEAEAGPPSAASDAGEGDEDGEQEVTWNDRAWGVLWEALELLDLMGDAVLVGRVWAEGAEARALLWPAVCCCAVSLAGFALRPSLFEHEVERQEDLAVFAPVRCFKALLYGPPEAVLEAGRVYQSYSMIMRFVEDFPQVVLSLAYTVDRGFQFLPAFMGIGSLFAILYTTHRATHGFPVHYLLLSYISPTHALEHQRDWRDVVARPTALCGHFITGAVALYAVGCLGGAALGPGAFALRAGIGGCGCVLAMALLLLATGWLVVHQPKPLVVDETMTRSHISMMFRHASTTELSGQGTPNSVTGAEFPELVASGLGPTGGRWGRSFLSSSVGSFLSGTDAEALAPSDGPEQALGPGALRAPSGEHGVTPIFPELGVLDLGATASGALSPPGRAGSPGGRAGTGQSQAGVLSPTDRRGAGPGGKFPTLRGHRSQTDRRERREQPLLEAVQESHDGLWDSPRSTDFFL
mmetsp:Transcript_123510/g.283198  ORF Transcript_123510/g.283198 Transcript_123510/m.283198 type:complete len:486 (+) Transcript_123510:35-1492(+)